MPQFQTNEDGSLSLLSSASPDYIRRLDGTLLFPSPPAFAGLATPTTPGSARLQVYNVRDYGAAGDGVTDDSAAVQAAITAAIAAGGGTVWVPVGVYLLGSTVTIPTAILLRGAGGWGSADGVSSRFKAKAGLNANMFAFTPTAPAGVVGARFAHLVFDGNNTNQTAGNTFYAQGAIQCHWQDCHFTNHWGQGLYLYQDGNGGTGHQNRVTHCLFDNGNAVSTGGADGRAILIQASDENVVEGCDFENNGATSSTAPCHIYDRSGLNVFLGNSFVNGQMGIKAEGSQTRIIGNIFDGLKNANVRLNGQGHNIDANQFIKVGASAGTNSTSAIVVDNVPDAAMVGNVIWTDVGGGTKYGIDLTVGTPTNALIGMNKFIQTPNTANFNIPVPFGTAPIGIGTGTGHRIHHNPGWNPAGPQTAPGMPTSGVALTNPFPYDAHVYVAGGTVSAIAIGGTATGLTSGGVSVPAGQTITLTYSAAPSWTWFAN